MENIISGGKMLDIISITTFIFEIMTLDVENVNYN